MNIAVSACLLGETCRYDGAAKLCEHVERLRNLPDVSLVPLCPETAGGLPVPRPRCEVVAGSHPVRVVSKDGADRTAAFRAGAECALAQAQEAACSLAVLKSKSPSCGSGRIYDGTFSGMLADGYGLTARLFRQNGIRVVDESELAACLEASERRHPGQPAALLATRSAECPTLLTERLVLRPLTNDDAPSVFAYCSDGRVGPNAGWEVHRTIDDALFYIREIASAPHVFGVFERNGEPASSLDPVPHGPCVGSVGLIPDPLRANVDALMLGYALAPAAWGRGLMTEAAREVLRYGFEELGLRFVTANRYVENDRSRRVIEKCGFAQEGIVHAIECDPDGMLRDVVSYVLAADSWRSAGA